MIQPRALLWFGRVNKVQNPEGCNLPLPAGKRNNSAIKKQQPGKKSPPY